MTSSFYYPPNHSSRNHRLSCPFHVPPACFQVPVTLHTGSALHSTLSWRMKCLQRVGLESGVPPFPGLVWGGSPACGLEGLACSLLLEKGCEMFGIEFRKTQGQGQWSSWWWGRPGGSFPVRVALRPQPLSGRPQGRRCREWLTFLWQGLNETEPQGACREQGSGCSGPGLGGTLQGLGSLYAPLELGLRGQHHSCCSVR